MIIQWKKGRTETGLKYTSACGEYVLEEYYHKYIPYYKGNYFTHAGLIVDRCNNLREAKWFADQHYMQNTPSGACYID